MYLPSGDYIIECGEVYEATGDVCKEEAGHVGFHNSGTLAWLTREEQEQKPMWFGRGEKMEDDLKMCRNKRCGRNQVLIVAPGRKYCSNCGAKLKNSWGHSLDPNQPPLIDPGPDEPPQKGGRRGFMHTTTNGHIIPFKPTEANGKLEPLSWSDFKGDKKDHEEYLADFRAGKITDNTPFMTKWAFEKAYGKAPAPAKDTFTCPDDVEKCPILTVDTHLVRIPHDMYRNWIWLCLRFNTEWLAYLKGTQDPETKVWSISDMYFPRQKVNSGHVDIADGEILPDTIGSVHSHVGMGAFFSAEDKAHFNHPVEMVINRSGDMAICVRMALECGRFSRVETKALLIGNELCQSMATELEAKMTEDRAFITNSQHSQHSGRPS